MPKPNRWRDFVREWGRQNNLSYACALSKPECKDAYRRKYGVAKKLPQKRERELMGMEDVNVRVRRVRRKRPIEFIIEEKEQEQEQPEENEYPIPELVPFQNIINENERKQRFRESKERFGMSSEDLLSRFSGQAEKAKQAKRRGLADVRQKALESEMRRNVEKRRQQLELSRMMGEDYRPLPRPSLRVEEVEEEIPFPREAKKKSKKPKPILVIEKKEKEVEAPKKKRGRPRKYSSAEEAYKAKIAQNRGYKQEEAKRIKEKMKAPKEASYEPLEEAFPTASSVKKPMNIQVKPREEEIIIRPKAKKAKKPKKKKAIPHEPLEEAFPTASSVKKPMNIQIKPREEEKEPEELKGLSRYKSVIIDYYISKNPNIFVFNIKNKQKLKEAQQRADDLVDDYIEQNIDNFARGKYDRIDEELLKLLDRIRNPQKPKPRTHEPLEEAFPQAKDVKKPMNIKIKKPDVDWKKSGYYKYIKFPPEVQRKLRKLADKDDWGLEVGDYFIMDDGTKIEVTRVGATKVKGRKSWEVSKLTSSYKQRDRHSPPVKVWDVSKIGWFFTRWELHFIGPIYRKDTGPQPRTLATEAFFRNTGKERLF